MKKSIICILLTVFAIFSILATTITSSTTVTTDSNHTVKAIWQKNSYNVTFKNDDGSTYSSGSIQYGNSFSSVFPANPSKNGYNFVGWFTGANGTGTKITDSTIAQPNGISVGYTLNAYFEKAIIYLRVGGVVCGDAGDNGATYKFYDSNKNEITGTIIGNASVYYYSVSGTPSKDRFFVVNIDQNSTKYTWGSCSWVTSSLMNGTGKQNTAYMFNNKHTSTYFTSTSIWKYCETTRNNNVGGCNDWYVPSYDEIQSYLYNNSGLLFEDCLTTEEKAYSNLKGYRLYNYIAKCLSQSRITSSNATSDTCPTNARYLMTSSNGKSNSGYYSQFYICPTTQGGSTMYGPARYSFDSSKDFLIQRNYSTNTSTSYTCLLLRSF